MHKMREGMKKFFKLFFNLIDKVYVTILIVFGFYSICCVLFKCNYEINWFEYAGAISMFFVVVGWIGARLSKFRNIESSDNKI